MFVVFNEVEVEKKKEIGERYKIIYSRKTNTKIGVGVIKKCKEE